MSSVPLPESPAATPASPLVAPPSLARPMLIGVGIVAALALAASVTLWQRLSSIQEQLARQSADAGSQSIEARTMARQAQETAQDAVSRVGVMEARLSEVSLQRSQLEELMQSLSRSRDDTLVVDIDSALRLAQQQADLTGTADPLLAALRSADQRIARAAQPRLAPVQRAIARDMERVRAASVTDVPGLLSRLDELVRMVDELPLQNAVAQAAAMHGGAAPLPEPDTSADPLWRATLRRAWFAVRDEARGLVRVSRIDQPEAVLLAPDQAFFLRENLKLKLVNARLGVLARQSNAARSDLAGAAFALQHYFEPGSRRVVTAGEMLKQAQAQMNGTSIPQPEETLSALATAAAGR
ncbi:uroporphyrinogen-III C-methyltransferase [Xylophilus sp. GOD-11R]|uniref:uroporphyrinogen-III C-methyltransferase n=1 Tax=Xylophilus sp. GOD-11R TaxID=3089814 RepID=UPI00298CE9C9|nr:uroporphyrinogen-III C-methyltransferase [Xylophilus sp. GOD-11R]WPB58054.1 uroporphyrinogen-III C-methyltransferase [Xylophilus sp. GOD-11R]